MPELTPLQRSFAAGEISPVLQVRSTARGHQEGAGKLRNFFADSRGPAIRRHGFRFLLNEGEPVPEIDPSLVCTEVTSFNDTYGPAGSDVFLLYDPDKDIFVYGQTQADPVIAEDKGIFLLEPDTLRITPAGVTDNTPLDGFWIGDIGQVGGQRWAAIAEEENSQFLIRRYILGDGDPPTWGWNRQLFISSSLAARPKAERANDICCAQVNGLAFLISDKDTWARVDLTIPTGWDVSSQLPAATVANDAVLWVLKNEADDTQAFSRFTTGDGTVIPTPTVPIRSDGRMADLQPKRVGDVIYWAINIEEGVQFRGQLLKTDLAGNELKLIDQGFSQGDRWSEGTVTVFFVSTDNNSMYWLQEGFIYRLDLATDEVERCFVQPVTDPSTGNPYPGQTYNGLIGIYDSGKTAFLHVPFAVATTIQIWAKTDLRLL